VLVGIERTLVNAGYIVPMAHTHENLERQRRVPNSMREQHAAGILICPALETPRTLARDVGSWGIPLVVMVCSLGAGNFDYVGSDNEKGVLIATRHIIAAGHKQIGFLDGRSGVVYEQRLRGYRSALAAAGLTMNDRLVVASDPNRSGGRDAMTTILRMRPRPTAAASYNDIVAFGALTTLGDQGLRAGDDLALVGFDNVLDAARSNPPLSTVNSGPASWASMPPRP
jgi:LacI family transcriptional regulator